MENNSLEKAQDRIEKYERIVDELIGRQQRPNIGGVLVEVLRQRADVAKSRIMARRDVRLKWASILGPIVVHVCEKIGIVPEKALGDLN